MWSASRASSAAAIDFRVALILSPMTITCCLPDAFAGCGDVPVSRRDRPLASPRLAAGTGWGGRVSRAGLDDGPHLGVWAWPAAVARLACAGELDGAGRRTGAAVHWSAPGGGKADEWVNNARGGVV
jgi:hypothetical protein